MRDEGQRGEQFPGRRITAGGTEKSQQCQKCFLQCSAFAPKDIRFEHRGAKLFCCPGRQLASLRPCVRRVLQQIISLPYPVTSHWWVSILDRERCMKTWNSTLKSFTQLKLITSTDNYFLFLWNNVYEFSGTNNCIPKRWPMGRAGLRGEQRGQLPRAPAARGPPWWNLFVSNKILFWKVFVILKRYKNTTLYYIPMLR